MSEPGARLDAMADSPFEVRPLDESTWPAFAALVEANNGIFGGCWCIGFHPEGTAGSAAVNRDRKLERVRAGTTHAALVFEGDACVGWCQFGAPDELPRIKNRVAYEKGVTDLPDWRIACNYAGKGHRRQGVATAGLAGALGPDRRARGRPGRGLPGGRRVGARRFPVPRGALHLRAAGVRARPQDRQAPVGRLDDGSTPARRKETSWLRSVIRRPAGSQVRRDQPAGRPVRRRRPVPRRDARGAGRGGGHRRPVVARERVLPRQRRRRDPLRRGRARPALPRPRRPTRRRPGGPARGLGRPPEHLGGHPRPRGRDAGRHGGRLRGRRVVVRADAAPPGPGHRHLAAARGAGDRAAVPPARPEGRRHRGRRHRGRRVGLHVGHPVVRRRARGPRGPRRPGGATSSPPSPRTSSPPRAGTRTPRSTPRPSGRACT